MRRIPFAFQHHENAIISNSIFFSSKKKNRTFNVHHNLYFFLFRSFNSFVNSDIWSFSSLISSHGRFQSDWLFHDTTISDQIEAKRKAGRKPSMIKNGTIWRHQTLIIFLLINDSVINVHVTARRINNHWRRPLFEYEIVLLLRTVEEVA